MSRTARMSGPATAATCAKSGVPASRPSNFFQAARMSS